MHHKLGSTDVLKLCHSEQMGRFFLIRHGETDWNRKRMLQGHTDIPLNSQGERQAEALRDLMSALKLDVLISSDLTRAHKTAVLSNPGRLIETTPLLREIFLGEAEGSSREEIQERWGQNLWDSWSDQSWPAYLTRFPGGESRREGIQRILELFSQRGSEFASEARIGLFTHGLLLRSFAQWAAHLEEPRFTTPNCCVYDWSWIGGPLNFDSPVAVRPSLRQIYLLEDESLSL